MKRESEMTKHLKRFTRSICSKRVKISGVLSIISVLASLLFVRSGMSSPTSSFVVEPKYTIAKEGDIIDVRVNVYGADYDEYTDVYGWQVVMEWDPAVLDVNSVAWGTFMDGPRVGHWGDLLYDAFAGQFELYVADSSMYDVGYNIVIQDDVSSETNVVYSIAGSKLIMSIPLANTYTVAANAGCYPDPNTGVALDLDNTVGRVIVGISTQGSAPGAQGDGTLCTLRFYVESCSSTALDITNDYTFIINSLEEAIGDAPGELNKENGYKAWAEDISANGLIDVYDLYWVGKDFAKYPLQTMHATTTSGAWTNGGNAYTPNNLYAQENTHNDAQTYKSFGFLTSGWTGVSKVEIGLERRTAGGGDDQVTIEISNNAGISWSLTTQTVVVTQTSDTFNWYDFTTAYSWTPVGVASIAVRITYQRVGTTGTYIYVDWIPVRVTPTPISTNSYSDITKDGVVDTNDLTQLADKYGLQYES